MKAQYDFAGGKRDAVLKAPAGKTRITIRINGDLLQWFRKQVHAAGGGSCQTLINQLPDADQHGTEGLRRLETRATGGDASQGLA